MLNTILRQTPVLGRLRYLLLDRHYSIVTRIFWVIVCLGLTVVSTVLFRSANASTPTSIILGFAPVLVLVGLAAFLVFYFNMDSLPVVVLGFTMFLHDGVGTGTGTKISFPFMMLCLWAALWLFKMFVVDRKVQVRYSPANYAGLVFMVLCVISYFWSYAYVDPIAQSTFESKILVRTMTLVVLLISVGAYFLYANFMRSVKQLQTFVWFFMVGGAILAVFRLINENIPLLNHSGQFPVWVSGLALGQALFNKSIPYRLRMALFGLVGIWGVIQFVLGFSWLSGWVPMGAALAIIIFFYSRRAFLILLIAGGIYYVSQNVFFSKAVSEENQTSGVTRVNAWGSVIELTKDHYLFGTGPAGYEFYFSAVSDLFQLSHNNYIDILAQTGVPGLLAFVSFWLLSLYMNLRLYWVIPKEGDFKHALAITLLAFSIVVFLIMMLGDWVTPFPYTQGLDGIDYDIWAWIMPGLSIALYYIYREDAQEVIPASVKDS